MAPSALKPAWGRADGSTAPRVGTGVEAGARAQLVAPRDGDRLAGGGGMASGGRPRCIHMV
jgi:hypothetical protein